MDAVIGSFVPPKEQARDVLDYAQIASPVLLFALFVVAFLTNNILEARKAQKTDGDETPPVLGPGGRPLPMRMKSSNKFENCKTTENVFSDATRLFFLGLTTAMMVTYLGNSVIIIAQAVLNRAYHWWCGQAPIIYVVGTCFVYSVMLITLIEAQPCPNWSHQLTWIVAIPSEFIILGASTSYYLAPHRQPVVADPTGGPISKAITPWEIVEIVLIFIRIFILFVSIFTYFIVIIARSYRRRHPSTSTPDESDETTGLLASSHLENGQANGHANGQTNGQAYGSGHPPVKSEADKAAEEGWCRSKTQQTKTWYEYIAGYRVFFPYLWPSKSRRLQMITLVCFGLVILQRIMNVLVPIQVRIITNILSGEDGNGARTPWGPICLYVVFRLLQGSQGLAGAVRSYLWIRVGQYSYRELSTAAFEHVHSLSLDFHIGKKTGEVISALNKGNSINQFLELVTFSVGPMLFDLVVAIGYFLVFFDVYYALVVTIIVFFYLYITVKLATWRNNIRRKMTDADRQEEAVKQDSLTLYETVKYFNAEKYEFNRYRNAIVEFQLQEYIVAVSLNILNTAQNSCFMVGLLLTCFIAGYQVAIGQQNVGGFTSLLVYMSQLQAPLNFVGSFYRTIQQSLINAERMLELFKEQPTVTDSPEARPMGGCQGKIEFKDVGFSYDARKPALNGLSFECTPGTTTALVGESGGGKSTVFRILFRFYNPESGKVLIDGNDVQDVTIDSLRSFIGVVPQETLLFNETLMYNLKYARQSATDEEVYEACRTASIHDKIMAFPDKYESKVGERGLRLSGGEKQRVAIARTILKNPKIIMLDEATAALDTETEEHIQEALATLSTGRTTLVIAHRLSTITKADQIVVLSDGKVAERGTHDDLLAAGGRYSSMWRKQIRAQKAAVQAEELQERARALLEAGGGDSSEQSEDEREINRILSPNDSEQRMRPGDTELGPAMASL